MGFSDSSGDLFKPLSSELVVDHRRVHPGRMDRVDPNAMRCKVVGVYPHQSDHPVLGSGVADGPGVVAADADQPGGRTDQHDGPAVALLDHRRLGDFDRVVHAGEVDVDDVAPAVFTREHWGDAGVGDDDVEPAEFVETRLQRCTQRLFIANISLLRHDSCAGVLDELDRGGEVVGCCHRVGNRCDLVTDVDRDDAGAVGSQPDRFRAALTAGGAGDERNLAFECTHQCPRFFAQALIRDAAGPWPGRPRRSAATS